MTKPFVVSIEGNIGAGKTTIIENLQKHLGNNKSIVFLREPVDVWDTVKGANGETMLQKFYEDPKQNAFPFQVMAYATRLSLIRKTIAENPDCDVIICERSIDADKQIFAKMLHDDGMINDMNFQIYNLFAREYAVEFALDGIVYIDSDAEVCHARIMKRSRLGEGGIELGYLQKCRRYHEEWLCNDHIPILKLDTNADVTYNAEDVDDMGMKWLRNIESFINEIVSKK